MKIAPNQSIIIPILTLLEPFENNSYEELSSVKQRINDYQMQEIAHGKLDTFNNVEILGPAIIPHAVNLVKSNSNVLQEIHPFDFSNMFILNRHWMIGCCPYIFFVNNNCIKYHDEIFAKAPNKPQYFQIIVPQDSKLFILCELEYETTYITSISLNGEAILKNLILNVGEKIEIEVKDGDLIEGIGYYSMELKGARKIIPNQKNELIKHYINGYKILLCN